MDDTWKEMRDAAGMLRDLFGLPRRFFSELLAENDWSFAIKLHAFVESAVTWALEEHLQATKLESFIAKWNLSGGRSNKVECCKALGILEPNDVRFIHGLSEIRNRLAHNVRQVSFDLIKHLEKMSTGEANKFIEHTMAHFWEESAAKAEKDQLRGRIFTEPKRYLLWSAIQLTAFLVLKVDVFKLERENEATARKALEMDLEYTRRMLAQLERKPADEREA